MTDSYADKIEKLQTQLFHCERQHARNEAERELIADQCAALRRQIDALKRGEYVGLSEAT